MSRRRILGVALLAVVAVAAPIAVDMPTKLLWNATASAPTRTGIQREWRLVMSPPPCA